MIRLTCNANVGIVGINRRSVTVAVVIGDDRYVVIVSDVFPGQVLLLCNDETLPAYCWLNPPDDLDRRYVISVYIFVLQVNGRVSGHGG